MKVLTRCVSESFVIGDEIVVTVKEVKSEHATLGIESLTHEFPYHEVTVAISSPEIDRLPSLIR